jgi:short-subunit dehydrogenase
LPPKAINKKGFPLLSGLGAMSFSVNQYLNKKSTSILLKFYMKTILITGGSTGIGKSIGEYLQTNGYKVYGTSRYPEKYLESKFELIALDVRNEASIKTAVAYILTKEKHLDVVINNAGVGITGPLEETPLAEIKNNFETNFYGPIAVIQAVLPQLRAQKSGLIINITSIAGYMGLPYRGVYSASKSALEILTEAISIEIKPFGVHITNVAPGEFATDIALSRYHSPIVNNSVYEMAYKNTLNQLNNHLNGGDNPIKMAIAIQKIIETKNPKLHYKVGAFMQKFSIVLKRILPDLMYQKMLMNHYGL